MTSILRASNSSTSFSRRVVEISSARSAQPGSRTPEHKAGGRVRSDSYSRLEAPAKKKSSCRPEAKKKDKAQFKPKAGKGKASGKLGQAQRGGSSGKVESACQTALKQIHAKIGELGSKLDQLLAKGGFPSLPPQAERCGCGIKDARERLCSDLGSKPGKPGPVSDRPAGCGDPAPPGQGCGPDGLTGQLEQVVQGLQHLLERLQELLGQKGCSTEQQNEFFLHLAKGCGTPVPAGSPAGESIRAVSSSFSSQSSGFTSVST
jgi:hypothetical protein